ncbi:MAG: 5'/3'-nucleotidase SurE [Chlamydiae bacterium]|nr:5'/3'-nucleotidase SurE [Chlamydiota bacterium]
MNFSKKLHVLLTNDDGIESAGLRYLWEGLKDNVDITVIAPDKERSGSGAAATLDRIVITPTSWYDTTTKAYKVSGTPVDCVRAGLSILLPTPPDMILSGINHGTNSGRTIVFSGTIGGVIEGVLRNIPGIAFSYWNYDTSDFGHTAKYIWPIVDYLSKQTMPHGSFYNVNFPKHLDQEIKGLKVVPHGFSNWIEQPEPFPSEEGHYSMRGVWVDHNEPEGTDVHYLKQGYVTASPIHIAQLTDFAVLDNHKEPFERSFQEHLKTPLFMH